MSTPHIRHWLYLLAAIVAEVGGTTIMKLSHGWSWPLAAESGMAAMLLCIGLSYWLLSLATTALPVGVAFACWEGLGLALITVSSVLVLHERMDGLRLMGLCCVLGGVLLIHKGTVQGDLQNASATERS